MISRQELATPLPDHGRELLEQRRRKERDGCSGCPPWVVRCVHIDDYRIWLADEEYPAAVDIYTRTGHIPLPYRWAVYEGPLAPSCICGIDHVSLAVPLPAGPQPSSYEDFNDALANFLAREERYHAECRNA